MSGGSFGYLYGKDPPEKLAGIVRELDRLLSYLPSEKFYDPAVRAERPLTEVERLALNCARGQLSLFAEKVRTLFEQVEKYDDLLHAIEWRASGDYGGDAVVESCKRFLEEMLGMKLPKEQP